MGASPRCAALGLTLARLLPPRSPRPTQSAAATLEALRSKLTDNQKQHDRLLSQLDEAALGADAATAAAIAEYRAKIVQQARHMSESTVPLAAALGERRAAETSSALTTVAHAAAAAAAAGAAAAADAADGEELEESTGEEDEAEGAAEGRDGMVHDGLVASHSPLRLAVASRVVSPTVPAGAWRRRNGKLVGNGPLLVVAVGRMLVALALRHVGAPIEALCAQLPDPMATVYDALMAMPSLPVTMTGDQLRLLVAHVNTELEIDFYQRRIGLLLPCFAGIFPAAAGKVASSARPPRLTLPTGGKAAPSVLDFHLPSQTTSHKPPTQLSITTQLSASWKVRRLGRGKVDGVEGAGGGEVGAGWGGGGVAWSDRFCCSLI